MRLFTTFTSKPTNLLPYDGTAFYYGQMLSQVEADSYFRLFLEHIPWRHDEMIMFGRHIVTSRQMSWFGDSTYEYTYSGFKHTAHLWTPELLALKAIVERVTGATFNACLLNLYHDGTQGLGWHSDNEKELGEQPIIGSLSLGAERRFLLKHKGTKELVTVHLEHGSLLLMRDKTQEHWIHSVPKSTKVREPRINLTFRRIIEH